jgi:dihydroneopterin aldolase
MKIALENMEFHAYHGCLEHEKQFGNTFLVSVAMELYLPLAGKTDKLSDTLNYQLVYDVVKAQMEIRSNLMEHLAQRIINSLSERFPGIQSLHVKLSKINPPLGGKTANVTVELKKE